MGAYDVRAVRHVPGRLAFGCTNLALAWPHGGTGLGTTNDIIPVRYGAGYAAQIEAFAGAPAEYLEAGDAWGVGFRLRTFDDDALSKVFPSTTVGVVSQRRVVIAPGSVHAGEWMSGRSFVLVFTPEGSTHAASATAPDADAPFFVLYRCLPVMADPLELRFKRGEDVGIRCAWIGIRDSSARTMAMGLRRDLMQTGVFP